MTTNDTNLLPESDKFVEQADSDFSKSLHEAADFVTRNVSLVVNGKKIDNPFEGTFTTAAVIIGAKNAEASAPELLGSALAKQRSTHLEEDRGYGPLEPYALKKVEQLLQVADLVRSDRLRVSEPAAAEAVIAAGNEHAYMGAARIDNNSRLSPGAHRFIIGTSGSEANSALIKAVFPDEYFGFKANPAELERGAGLIDELVSRMVGGVMILKALGVQMPDEPITLELKELQKDQVAATEKAISEVPGNKNPDGSQKISIN